MDDPSTTTASVSVDASPAVAVRVHRLFVVFTPELAADVGTHWDWSLPPGRVLGRDPGTDGIRLVDRRVSGRHASVRPVAGGDAFRLEDLGSKNGTRLNGHPVEAPTTLQPGDVVRLGSTLAVYASVAVPAPVALGLTTRPGVSLALAAARAVADRAAETDRPVLISGPTGAGKERMARRIHDRSGRRGAFVAVNCAALAPHLVASELFGHAKGAFTGASEPRKGRFRLADGGTLFLDEIGDLPESQQPLLLRALEEREVWPVGGDRSVPVDVRVVAASQRPLRDLEAAGEFRGDLVARLAGFEVRVPPLADRREEVLALLGTYLGEHVARLTADAAEALLCYAWPHNVRDVQRVASAVGVYADSADRLDRSVLPSDVVEQAEERTRTVGADRPSREELERLLAEHGGVVRRVARALGKGRTQVYRWLDRYRLDPDDYRP